MPCDTMRQLTPAQEAARAKALRDLEEQLEKGKVQALRDRFGKVTFQGWETDRENPGHWHDDCAYRTLTAAGSSALRLALARSQSATQARTVTQ